jgi:hypothetical protein
MWRGTVTNSETGDAGEAETEPGHDGEAYEVGIRRADGSQVEAELDSNFNVTRGSGNRAAQGVRNHPASRLRLAIRAHRDYGSPRREAAREAAPVSLRLSLFVGA